MVEIDALELAARTPVSVERRFLNPDAIIPHGVTPDHVFAALEEFTDWLGFINTQMGTRNLPRFETMLMPANFSSMVGEFMTATIPKHCHTIVKNNYHNGHPDMVPTEMYPDDSVQHAPVGIEVKGSRYEKGWQGHNPEETWLMVFVFASNRPVDVSQNIEPFSFQIKQVLGGPLLEEDWKFSGRSATSRRTITAAVKPSGYEKMRRNWIYLDPR